jgi:hypothetical protein
MSRDVSNVQAAISLYYKVVGKSLSVLNVMSKKMIASFLLKRPEWIHVVFAITCKRSGRPAELIRVRGESAA